MRYYECSVYTHNTLYMFTVQCTLYIFTVQCTVYMYTVHYTLDIIQCILYNGVHEQGL